MAAAVVEARTEHGGAVDRAAIRGVTRREREALGFLDAVDRLAAEQVNVAVVVLVGRDVPSNFRPSKLVSMMKLTTPATASAP